MHKLIYLRTATKRQDGADGLLYRHEWLTGWQDLVFSSHRAAEAFLYEAGKAPNGEDLFA